MNWKDTKNWILSGKFLYDKKLSIILWFGLSFIAILQDVIGNHINNYIIFKHVYLHTIQETNLYLEYPNEYLDVNLYGPVFSILIAPFTYLPDNIAAIAWEMFNVLTLFLALMQLPIADKWKNAIIILSAHEMMNASSWLQSNALIAACIIFGFVYINRGKDIIALFFILLATFVKLYGIVGFAFFFFSKNKLKFIGWAFLWSIIFFVLPLLITSKTFLIQSYNDWLMGLQHKVVKNVNPNDNYDFQDICVMGMIRRIFNIPYLKNYYISVPAVIMFGLQYLRFEYFKDTRYRLYLLCSVLITTVIFTTSAESPTYIIAFPAACIWYIMQEHNKIINAFFIFILLLTSFSYSDIFTPYLRENIIRPYSLKALPSFILWIIIIKQVLGKQFLNIPCDRVLMAH